MTRAVPPWVTSVRASNQRASVASRSSAGGQACAWGAAFVRTASRRSTSDRGASIGSAHAGQQLGDDRLAAMADLDGRADAGRAAVGALAALDRLAARPDEVVDEGEQPLGQPHAAGHGV